MYWSSCGSDQETCLEELLVANSFGVVHGERPRGVVLPSFFSMTYMELTSESSTF